MRWFDTDDQAAQLAKLTTREARKAPGVPARWSRFLVAHALWIVVVTLVAVAAAAALMLRSTPMYTAQAVVVVEPAASAADNGAGPNMATEEAVVNSWAVLSKASVALHVPVPALQQGMSVSVPGTTSVLEIKYSDQAPAVAQLRADAIARAYVAYRTPKVATGKKAAASAAAAPASTAPTATLVTPAALPAKPSNRDYTIDLGAALLVGLVLAIGSAALRDYLDDRVRGPLDAEAQTGAPVLAIIPAFRGRHKGPGGRLIMTTHPDSVAAEAYRGLRTRVVQAAAGRNATTVVVTSPGWEDKSTVAANLSAALAQRGSRVLLQCGDQRWGHVQELQELLVPGNRASRDGAGRDGAGRDGASRDSAGRDGAGRDGASRDGARPERTSLTQALQPTAVSGLRLLPPGAISADPAQPPQDPDRRDAQTALMHDADFVVIEAPPLLAGPRFAPYTELADMIIVVADARRSTRTQLRLAMRELEHVHNKLAGCVLDNVGRAHYFRPRIKIS